MVKQVGAELAERVRDATLRIYKFAADYARERGIIMADTKFEFGTDADGRLYIMDEMLTPDSSRYWPADGTKWAPARRATTSSSCATGWRRWTGADRPGPEHPGRDHRAHPRQVRRGAAAPGRDQRRLIRLRPRPERRGAL
jgi:phosphoribosylaminoimidazole-succinocarboxamide synthase